MMTKFDQTSLSARQKKALPFFISSSSEVEACRLSKVSKQTFYEWLKNPLFKSELERLRNELINEAVGNLKANIGKAVNTLVILLDDTNSQVRRGAANDILNHIAKFKELQELEDRIESLERRQMHAAVN
jgi:hypothetical protein